jgi:hypothetical protein
MKALLLVVSLAVLLLAPIVAVCVLAPRWEEPANGIALKSFTVDIATVVTKEDCTVVLGEPDSRVEYIGGPLNGLVSEAWTYRVHDGVRVLDARVWWDINTGHKCRVIFHDPVSGEVLR